MTDVQCKSHEKIHMAVKSYACLTHGKMFTCNGNLKIHERIHACVKSYMHVLLVETCSHIMKILKCMNVFKPM